MTGVVSLAPSFLYIFNKKEDKLFNSLYFLEKIHIFCSICTKVVDEITNIVVYF